MTGLAEPHVSFFPSDPSNTEELKFVSSHWSMHRVSNKLFHFQMPPKRKADTAGSATAAEQSTSKSAEKKIKVDPAVDAPGTAKDTIDKFKESDGSPSLSGRI